MMALKLYSIFTMLLLAVTIFLICSIRIWWMPALFMLHVLRIVGSSVCELLVHELRRLCSAAPRLRSTAPPPLADTRVMRRPQIHFDAVAVMASGESSDSKDQ